MIRLSLALALCGCAAAPAPLPPPAVEVRPVVAADRLQGRWSITAVNGRPADGLWLELGGEGLGTSERRGDAVFFRSPSPPSKAFLGCNDWHPQGWARNGDKLTLGREGAHMTERGCEDRTLTMENQAHAVLSETMTMELTPPDRLRLVNEAGTLDLVRATGVR